MINWKRRFDFFPIVSYIIAIIADLQNHYLKIQHLEHYKYLISQAKEHEEGLYRAPTVEKETVDKALTEKLALAKQLQRDLEGKILDHQLLQLKEIFKNRMWKIDRRNWSDT